MDILKNLKRHIRESPWESKKYRMKPIGSFEEFEGQSSEIRFGISEEWKKKLRLYLRNQNRIRRETYNICLESKYVFFVFFFCVFVFFGLWGCDGFGVVRWFRERFLYSEHFL